MNVLTVKPTVAGRAERFSSVTSISKGTPGNTFDCGIDKEATTGGASAAVAERAAKSSRMRLDVRFMTDLLRHKRVDTTANFEILRMPRSASVQLPQVKSSDAVVRLRFRSARSCGSEKTEGNG